MKFDRPIAVLPDYCVSDELPDGSIVRRATNGALWVPFQWRYPVCPECGAVDDHQRGCTLVGVTERVRA